jgi:hypothetical protein
MAKDLKTLIKTMDKIKSDSEKQIEKIKSKALTAQKKNFENALKMLFENFPKLESFSWLQYTPHWNDGDECNFSASTDYIEINGEEEVSIYSISEKLKRIKNKKKLGPQLEKDLTEAKNAKKDQWRIDQLEREIKELEEDPAEVEAQLEMTEAVIGVLGSLNDDMFLEMFGDHAKVTVTADGAEVEEYEHD